MVAAPLLIVVVAVFLVLAWLGIVDAGEEVSGWAVIAGVVAVAGIILRITED